MPWIVGHMMVWQCSQCLASVCVTETTMAVTDNYCLPPLSRLPVTLSHPSLVYLFS